MLEIDRNSWSTSPRTVLITGVAGYIGSHTALAFLDAGWQVVGIDNLSVGKQRAVPQGLDFIQIDCTDPALPLIMRQMNIDAAVHFAGLIRVDESVQKPVEYYQANLCNAGAFFKSALAMGIKAVVFSSTAAVYGDTGSAPVVENTPTLPVSPYGRSKLAAEWVLRDLCAASDLRHVIFRYFNVAGADPCGRAGPRKDASHLIKAVSEAAVGRRPGLVINGEDYDTPDGTCVRDYIHVSDLADAHVAAVTHLLHGGQSMTLNCGYGRGFSVRDVIDRALPLADRPFDVAVGPRRPGDSPSVVADVQALWKALRWTPRFDDLGLILKTAIDWDRATLLSEPEAAETAGQQA